MERKVTTETLVEPAKNFLKNNIFQFDKKALKQLQGTAARTTFAHRMQFYLSLTLKKEF